MAFSVQTVEKRRYIFFQERGRDWETKGQHICSANASHLWLSASLAVWVSQLESAVGIHFRRGKQHVSRHFYADGYSAPRRNGGSEADFAKQSA